MYFGLITLLLYIKAADFNFINFASIYAYNAPFSIF